MDVQKTKRELYIERLEKWRQEKNLNKKPLNENKSLNIKASSSSKKTSTVSKVDTGIVRKLRLSQAACRPPPTLSRPSLPAARKSTSNIQRRATIGQQQVKKNNTVGLSQKRRPVYSTTAVKKPVQKSQNQNDEAALLEKLQKWREEKTGSCKKSVYTAPKGDNKDPPKFREVKSRLFDFMNAKKPVNKFVPKSDIKHEQKTAPSRVSTVRRSNLTQVKPSQKKTAIKRRHSEVIKTEPVKQLASILKRKSCIGLFVDPDLESHSEKDGRLDNSDTGCEPFTPGTARSVRFLSPADRPVRQQDGISVRKTPAKTKKTQAMMMDQLNNWLKAKGRTPSKFRHLTCFDAEMKEQKEQDPQTKRSISVDELKEQMEVIQYEAYEPEMMNKLHTMLQECTRLSEEGCPTEDILGWLDHIYTNIPAAQTSSQFYMCKAVVLKSTLDLDAILSVFEAALVNKAEPREDVARCMTEVIKEVTEMREKQAKTRTRTPRKSLVQPENMFQSSAIVYTVSEVTPFSQRSRRSDHGPLSEGCKVVTPVRRSTRRSLQNLPESLRDKKHCYTSLDQVDKQSKDNMLFKPNLALDDVLAESQNDC